MLATVPQISPKGQPCKQIFLFRDSCLGSAILALPEQIPIKDSFIRETDKLLKKHIKIKVPRRAKNIFKKRINLDDLAHLMLNIMS